MREEMSWKSRGKLPEGLKGMACHGLDFDGRGAGIYIYSTFNGRILNQTNAKIDNQNDSRVTKVGFKVEQVKHHLVELSKPFINDFLRDGYR